MERQLRDNYASRIDIEPLRQRARDAWRVMKRRCLDLKFRDYRRYGGAGITVQETWKASFESFLGDVGLPPSALHWLGRKNTAGNYEKANVEWTTRAPQVRRRQYCRRVRLNGSETTIAEAARVLGLVDTTLRRRITKQERPLREAVSRSRLLRRDSALLTHEGVTLPLPVWARLLRIDRRMLWTRIKSGWPVARALTEPKRAPSPARRQVLTHEGARA